MYYIPYNNYKQVKTTGGEASGSKKRFHTIRREFIYEFVNRTFLLLGVVLFTGIIMHELYELFMNI